jgi:hypothetical protein
MGRSGVSFFEKARQAANQAADQARQAAEQARQRATDPATHEKARQAMATAGTSARSAGSAAKRGMGSMIDRIDPGLLADIVIKATALQEKANAALRAKGSMYRVAEITITAALPPQVGFSVSRIGDAEEAVTGQEVSSTELVELEPESSQEQVVSLDGTVDQEALAQELEDMANEEASAP